MNPKTPPPNITLAPATFAPPVVRTCLVPTPPYRESLEVDARFVVPLTEKLPKAFMVLGAEIWTSLDAPPKVVTVVGCEGCPAGVYNLVHSEVRVGNVLWCNYNGPDEQTLKIL